MTNARARSAPPKTAPLADARRSLAFVVTTKNRREELHRTLSILRRQDHRPLEIAVFDDGSDDGTPEMVRAEFPEARLFVARDGRGYIRARNDAARSLSAEYLFHLDDDSWPLSDDAARRVVEGFERMPDAVGLAFEIFVDSHRPLPPEPARDGRPTATFVGCGFALRRERFLALGGFEEMFGFYGEEADFAMRAVDSPHPIRFLSGVRVFHAITSTGRDPGRIFRQALANSLTMYALREPAPDAAIHGAWTLARFAFAALKETLRSRNPARIADLARALGIVARRAPLIVERRRPVAPASLREYRRLVREWAAWFREREASRLPRDPVPDLALPRGAAPDSFAS